VYSRELLVRYAAIAGYVNSHFYWLTLPLHGVLVLFLGLGIFLFFRRPGVTPSNLLKIGFSASFLVGGVFFLLAFGFATTTELLSFLWRKAEAPWSTAPPTATTSAPTQRSLRPPRSLLRSSRTCPTHATDSFAATACTPRGLGAPGLACPTSCALPRRVGNASMHRSPPRTSVCPSRTATRACGYSSLVPPGLG
jgi:hypothetical protein